MSKEFSIDEVSELMILFEQAEELLGNDDKEALKNAHDLFNFRLEIKEKQTAILAGPDEEAELWDRVLTEVPGAKLALKHKFDKAKELLVLLETKKIPRQ